MVNEALLDRMVDEMGGRRAVDACVELVADLDAAIADFVAQHSAAQVLTAIGKRSSQMPEETASKAVDALTRLVDGHGGQLSRDRDQLLRQFVRHVMSEVGPEPLAHALVNEHAPPVLELV